ncbi:MAG: HAMP domain-containing sensor histidine kinase, partial [bacterium]|nr:HAMP domain-containing sensor histidine kinase [bacterium]
YEVEKKARIELEELDKAKDQFILTTQHHLRTPLTIVKGFIELSLDEKITDRMRTYLQKANESTLRMTDLVNEFLNVSKQQNSSLNFNREAVNVATLLSELKSELVTELEKKHLAFNISFTPEASAAQVFVEKKSTRMAFFNLVDNAIKYTLSGSISIEGVITLHPIEKTKRLRIKIIDTGIGVSDKDLPKLFSRFFEQGEEAQLINTTGKGIGLAFSKNVINAYEGNISAESEGPGKGTTFIIELPVM